jgi:hypothetical protein
MHVAACKVPDCGVHRQHMRVAHDELAALREIGSGGRTRTDAACASGDCGAKELPACQAGLGC